MSLIIPHVGDTTNEVFSVSIEGLVYEFNIRYNTRDESWTLFLGVLGSEFVCKTKLTIGFDLLAPYKHITNVPQGELYLIDTELYFGRPSRDNMGFNKRFKLFYYTVDEV